MTETIGFNHVNVEVVCRVCFGSVSSVRLATLSEIDALQTLGLQKYFHSLDVVHLCVYCRGLLRKFNRFLAQCEVANRFFEEHHEELPTLACPLSTTTVDFQYIGPKEEKYEESIYLDCMPIEGDEKLMKEEIGDDDDDMPLALFNDSGGSEKEDTPVKKKKRKKRSAKDKTKKENSKSTLHVAEDIKIEQTSDTPVPLATVPLGPVKGNNTNGLSTRMVAETNEYVVIKLTKEEVIQEIREKLAQQRYLDARYKCAECAKGFNFEDVYNKHLEKHRPKAGHQQCDVCHIYCPSAVSMRGHLKSHTTRYRCKVCGCVRAGRQHLEEHFSLSHSAERRQYRCERCTFVTDKRTTMIRHSARHSVSAGLPCELCAKLCRSEEALRVHRMRHDTSSHHQCSVCCKRFLYRPELRRHAAAAHERREHYCVECDQHFNSADNLRHHFKRSKKHRDPSVFSCRACPKQFTSQPDLTSHLQEHKTTRRFPCAHCDKSYVWRDSLRAHVKRVHSAGSSERFACSVCDKVFKKHQTPLEPPKEQFVNPENI